MNNVDALKKLYTQLGGSAADVANVSQISDMIEAVSEQAATATAPELPEVSAADNGDLLGVSSGAWAKVSPAERKGRQFAIDYTVGDTQETLKSSKTLGDIVAAIKSGDVVTLQFGSAATPSFCAPVFYEDLGGGSYAIFFEGIDFENPALVRWTIAGYATETKAYLEKRVAIPTE